MSVTCDKRRAATVASYDTVYCSPGRPLMDAVESEKPGSQMAGAGMGVFVGSGIGVGVGSGWRTVMERCWAELRAIIVLVPFGVTIEQVAIAPMPETLYVPGANPCGTLTVIAPKTG